MNGHSTKYSRTKTVSSDLLLLFSEFNELVSDVNGVIICQLKGFDTPHGSLAVVEEIIL
jgi:hypothetical protein